MELLGPRGRVERQRGGPAGQALREGPGHGGLRDRGQPGPPGAVLARLLRRRQGPAHPGCRRRGLALRAPGCGSRGACACKLDQGAARGRRRPGP
eukprot:9205802-Lingulodinium_polyedra.AAC.1